MESIPSWDGPAWVRSIDSNMLHKVSYRIYVIYYNSKMKELVG
jgi:hypothetical protein